MGFFQCLKNTGVFHNKICKCTDNEAEATRITFFGKSAIEEYKNELKRIICTYEDFSTFQDKEETKQYLDAKEKFEVLKNY